MDIAVDGILPDSMRKYALTRVLDCKGPDKGYCIRIPDANTSTKFLLNFNIDKGFSYINFVAVPDKLFSMH